ncbi:hypothetical protein EYF80_056452 [Liparis tanakae]|uniref:Uncharacterized protein n=1 Tax=Liparis tanakae TaxID=230148 RepID=A0A4Z2EWQ5_9TELE|nr:hypothetical protein EYF80_056452 [Liparis tanakae]
MQLHASTADCKLLSFTIYISSRDRGGRRHQTRPPGRALEFGLQTGPRGRWKPSDGVPSDQITPAGLSTGIRVRTRGAMGVNSNTSKKNK